MALTHDEVREILAIIDSSAPAEIQVQTDGFSLHVVIGDSAPSAVIPAPPGPPPRASAPAPEPDEPRRVGQETIESPMLGTFYRSESPTADPFVEVGSIVAADTVVCIIEVMKMMSSITAGIAGTIVEIVPENAQLVEFGQPLFRVEVA